MIWIGVVVISCFIFFGCSKVTVENYDKIDLGMEYQQVLDIIGEPDTCDAGMGTKKCVWGDKEKNITITFVADKVIAPSMKGL